MHVGSGNDFSRLIIGSHPRFGISEQNFVRTLSVVLFVGKIRSFGFAVSNLLIYNRLFLFVDKIIETPRMQEISFLFINSTYE